MNYEDEAVYYIGLLRSKEEVVYELLMLMMYFKKHYIILVCFVTSFITLPNKDFSLKRGKPIIRHSGFSVRAWQSILEYGSFQKCR